MAIVEVLHWRQTVRDGAGRVLAQRDLSLSPHPPSVRQAAIDFPKYVAQNDGHLETSLTAEAKEIKTQLAGMLQKMNAARTAEEIRSLQAPVRTAVELLSYLEYMLEPMRLPKLEGALHIVRYASPTPGPEIFAAMFSPYLSPGGAMKPRIIAGREALVDFLTREVQLGNDTIPVIFADIDQRGSVSWPNVQLSPQRIKELNLA